MIILRKLLTISLIICIILVGLCQFVVPGMISSTANSKLRDALQTQQVNSELSTVPGFMLMFGQIDKLHIEAENGKLGNIRCSKLVLDGKNVNADISAFDLQDGSAVKSADMLTLTGTITEDNLKEYMRDKLEGVGDLNVKMTSNYTTATGNIKLLGQPAEVSISGNFSVDKEKLYFQMASIDIKNSLLGHAVIGNMFGDMLLLDLQDISFPSEFDSVEQHEGYVTLKASRKARGFDK